MTDVEESADTSHFDFVDYDGVDGGDNIKTP